MAACDWEREQLRNVFCKNHPKLKLKDFDTMDHLEHWMDTNHPKPIPTARPVDPTHIRPYIPVSATVS